MITEAQADALNKLIVDALPPGDIDGSTQKMLMLVIKTIKGAVFSDRGTDEGNQDEIRAE